MYTRCNSINLKLLSALALSLLFTSCATKSNLYHSTAGAKFTSVKTETKLTVIEGKQKKLKYPSKYGVISAIDNQSLRYTLIAPYRGMANSKPELSKFSLGESVPLTIDKVQQLISIVDRAIVDWNKDYKKTKGHSLRYSAFSENEQGFVFQYQNGQESMLSRTKPIVTLVIRTGSKYQYVNAPNNIVYNRTYTYKIRNLEELKGFRDLLSLSLI